MKKLEVNNNVLFLQLKTPSEKDFCGRLIRKNFEKLFDEIK